MFLRILRSLATEGCDTNPVDGQTKALNPGENIPRGETKL